MDRCQLPERAGMIVPADLEERRQAMASAVAAGIWRTDLRPLEMNFGKVRALGFNPPELSNGTLVHFHGGGFRLGCPEMTSPYAAELARECGMEVVCPAYRLAPEYPFPAGLNDGMAVLRGLHDAGRRDIWLSGDSAGGGLAASLTALCVAEQIPLSGLVLLSPWLDLTVTGECYAINAASDRVFSQAAASQAAEQYLQGMAADNPLASPLFGELDRYPPTFISVGAGEVLADDARRFFAALQDKEVEVELCAIEGMEHTAVLRSFDMTGAADTFHALTNFICRVSGAR